jgi:hypothetical protein
VRLLRRGSALRQKTGFTSDLLGRPLHPSNRLGARPEELARGLGKPQVLTGLQALMVDAAARVRVRAQGLLGVAKAEREAHHARELDLVDEGAEEHRDGSGDFEEKAGHRAL